MSHLENSGNNIPTDGDHLSQASSNNSDTNNNKKGSNTKILPQSRTPRMTANSLPQFKGNFHNRRRRSSISDDIRNIVEHLGSTNIWDRVTAAKFTMFYVLFGCLFATITYSNWVFRMQALNTATGSIQVLFIVTAFNSHLGANPTRSAIGSALFVAFLVFLGGLLFYLWGLSDGNALENDCGFDAYFEQLADEKTVNYLSLSGTAINVFITLAHYFVWKKTNSALEEDRYNKLVALKLETKNKAKYPTASDLPPTQASQQEEEGENEFGDHDKAINSKKVDEDEYYQEAEEYTPSITLDKYTRMYDSKSMHWVFVGGICFTGLVGMLCDMAVLPRMAIPQSYSLVFLSILFTNFFLDSSFIRKIRGLRRTRRSPAYLFTCCTTLIPAVNALTLLRDTILVSHGALASSISISFFSIILIFLWETMAIKVRLEEERRKAGRRAGAKRQLVL